MKIFHHPTATRTGLGADTVTKAAHIARSLDDRPIAGVEVVAPTPTTLAELTSVHDRAYLDALVSGRPAELAESNGIGWNDRLLAAVTASTGGVRDAALDALATGGIAGALSSGLHHARRDHGAGYCTVNGIVVAARAALAAGAGRVLVLDLDAHCGGGTAELIDGLDGVEQVDVSVIPYDRYPSRPDARLTLTDGPAYLDTIRRAIDDITTPASIDLVLYNAGVDPHGRAGGLRTIDTPTIATREDLVFAWADAHHLPIAWVLAGGYTVGGDMAHLVDLHRLTISAAAGVPASA